MTAETEQLEDEEPPKKKSKGLLFGVIGAVLLGGATFFGIYSGMIPLPFGGGGEEDSAGEEQADGEKGDETADGGDGAPALLDVAFVVMDPIVISLSPESRSKHLKVSVTIEVRPGSESEVEKVKPRIVDVLNTFLRAVNEQDLELPRSMIRLRAQMLRRVQLVAPKDTVRDVLIQEFVLN